MEKEYINKAIEYILGFECCSKFTLNELKKAGKEVFNFEPVERQTGFKAIKNFDMNNLDNITIGDLIKYLQQFEANLMLNASWNYGDIAEIGIGENVPEDDERYIYRIANQITSRVSINRQNENKKKKVLDEIDKQIASL